jgi:DNA-binding response OmpR family regulator
VANQPPEAARLDNPADHAGPIDRTARLDMIRKGTRILVVEDDASISRLLQLELEHRDIVVRVEDNGLGALSAIESFRPDAVILDILLPAMDGEHVLSRIRGEGRQVPVIMLTARDAPRDKVRNLNTGADDYITKPFEIEELLARLGAVLRRVQPPAVLRVDDLEIDPDAGTVRRSDGPIQLTAREFDLLAYLARNANHVLSREQILDAIWRAADVDPNVVDVYIGYLRRKVDRGRNPLIHTVRGMGFAMRSQ